MAYTYDKQPACRVQQSAAGVPVNTTFVPGASATTPAFGAQTRLIRICNGGTVAFFNVGDGAPVASSSSMVMGTNLVEYFMVNPGQKCAVFGTGGTLSVTEVE